MGGWVRDQVNFDFDRLFLLKAPMISTNVLHTGQRNGINYRVKNCGLVNREICGKISVYTRIERNLNQFRIECSIIPKRRILSNWSLGAGS